MTDGQFDFLAHSIGMDEDNFGKPLAWWLDADKHRNHFAIGPECDGWADIQALVAMGFMFRGADIGSMGCFHATASGISHARDRYREKRANEKRRRED